MISPSSCPRPNWTSRRPRRFMWWAQRPRTIRTIKTWSIKNERRGEAAPHQSCEIRRRGALSPEHVTMFYRRIFLWGEWRAPRRLIFRSSLKKQTAGKRNVPKQDISVRLEEEVRELTSPRTLFVDPIIFFGRSGRKILHSPRSTLVQTGLNWGWGSSWRTSPPFERTKTWSIKNERHGTSPARSDVVTVLSHNVQRFSAWSELYS